MNANDNNNNKGKTADGKDIIPSVGMGGGMMQGIIHINLGDEMKKSYMEYAMSVIVARALPDVRDGLKPVHRRILYAMHENGYDWSKPFRKSARIVGEVMGKYHPHGDQAIYDSMVRMAQDFSLRLPLIAGQGNFGSLDGDPPAAMRYTEARLAKSAKTLLTDIDNDTVDFGTNYDDSISEPLVLPARIPNLLANGASGIAVGMATNIPPHNLGELLRALISLVNNPAMSDDEIKKIVPGPDFPTGGLILGREGIDQSFATGRGSIKMRGRAAIETFGKEREMIVITEIPYQVNKSSMIEKMAELVQNKVIEGISDIRDESDRTGVRVVLEVKRDATAQVILQQLYKFSPLETSFGVNMLSLNNGLPEMLPVPRVLHRFVEFRDEVIQRRSRFLLSKARDRAHIVAGLIIASDNIDEMIVMIRSSKDAEEARKKMTAKQWSATAVVPFLKLIDKVDSNLVGTKYKLSDEQAHAILELRLQRLTALEKDKLANEIKELSDNIIYYEKLLADKKARRDLMITEFEEVLTLHDTKRRTEIVAKQEDVEITDLIEKEEMMVSVTYGGYIKRVSLDSYRTQKRGGKGKIGMTTKEDDFIWKVFVANTHTDMLFFSSNGRCYKLKVYEIPESSMTSKGKALVNILPLAARERITTVLALPADAKEWEDKFMVFATASGYVRRNLLSDFADERKAGKVAMKLDDGDSLVGVLIASAEQDIFLATEQSAAIRFPISRPAEDGSDKGVRVFSGRASNGVTAVKLANDDCVVAMDVLNRGEEDSEKRDGYLAVANAKARLKDKTYAAADSDDALRDKSKVAEFDKSLFSKMAGEEQFVLTVNEMGFGQLCSSYDYRTTNRGGKGISNMDSSGKIIDAFLITPKDDEVMIVTDAGQTIRIQTKSIRRTSRNAKGVKLASLDSEQKIASVAHINYIKDEKIDALAATEEKTDSQTATEDATDDMETTTDATTDAPTTKEETEE